jgi:PBP1b-binding outer membrane lipoprotein LpoB
MFVSIMKYLTVAMFAVLLCSCAAKPPVQEMAEARSAIERAQQLENKGLRANRMLKSAEQSLEEAAAAIDARHYDMARHKAVEAKRKAQLAAKIRHAPSDR